MPEAPQGRLTPTPSDRFPATFSAILRDMLMLCALAVLFFIAASQFELFEIVTRATHRYEHWQLDELPLTLLVLSVGLSWFGWRRVREIRSELTERVRAQTQVAQLLAHNRELLQRLITVQESERRALARELHDELGQHCTAMRAEASFIGQAGGPEGVTQSASRIAQSASTLYGLVNGMLRRLRPPALDSLGLSPALLELCDTWAKQTGLTCRFEAPDVPQVLGDATAVTLFRLVQEALTNVARHADATQVWVSLRLDGSNHRLCLSVKDNGCGMAQTDGTVSGLGFVGMRERVAALQGRIEWRSQPGHGVQIDVSLPYPEITP